MAFLKAPLAFCLLFLFLQLVLNLGSNDSERKTYIVYMGDLPERTSSLTALHHSLLHTVLGDYGVAKESLLHSYTKSFNAFAAKLRPEQAERIREMEGVVSVFLSKTRHLHTTKSWDFIGFPETVPRNLKMESDVIIGLLDTGIWPDSPSFDDKGLGPPPFRWKGKCDTGPNFTGCNNKVIGARYYYHTSPGDKSGDLLSPVDHEGHGTHTASTAGGAPVEDASLYGLAKGTARGAVPSARLAMYKVCWAEGCRDVNLLAGFDDAIHDGVDVLSISLGARYEGHPNTIGAEKLGDVLSDPIAIGAFHAMKKGIFVSCSAGNSGPSLQTVTNSAPWIMTVAASSIGREFRTKVEIGSGKKFNGFSINTFSPKKRMYPLIMGAQAMNKSVEVGRPGACDFQYLVENKVKGKIVYCDEYSFNPPETVAELGGAGTVVGIRNVGDTPYAFRIPTALINYRLSKHMEEYANSTRAPRAVIHKSIVVHKRKAPLVASFSSRGPNVASTRILKPDITAPGLNILAAYSPLSTVTGSEEDPRHVGYSILSGTSMSCPHVAGAAAYVKSFHPSWSPAAIKSALITTATEIKHGEWRDMPNEFSYGAGQINPVQALNPGLVYDADELSYISFLCKEGINGSLLAPLVGKPVNCSRMRPSRGSDGLNYPSMQFKVEAGMSGRPFATNFRRLVTNVGTRRAVYKAIVTSKNKLLKVTVIPDTLNFTKRNEKKWFKVIVRGGPLGDLGGVSGSLVWSNSVNRVRSPIVIYKEMF
ncbi:subtilisin-like protease SBT4.14 [Aristolochia californica]|uniref:subtilisin-like protease SBT4.14 n=1 Tax=Aristolochia californica TaxID=171875 RepID=UPI0035DE398C